MSEVTYLPGTPMYEADQAVERFRAMYGSGVMAVPDQDVYFDVPKSVAQQIFTQPDGAPELRGLLGASEGDALVVLPNGLNSDDSPQVLVRRCGPETSNGTCDVISTVRIASQPVGALAAWGARLTFREPKTTLHFIGWHGIGLPPDQES